MPNSLQTSAMFTARTPKRMNTEVARWIKESFGSIMVKSVEGCSIFGCKSTLQDPRGNENNVKTFPKSIVSKVQPPLVEEPLELFLLKTSTFDLVHNRVDCPLFRCAEIGLL